MKDFWLSEHECSGCGACANICPKNAIKLLPNKLGFIVPVIGENCIDCNACEEVCRKRFQICKNGSYPMVFAAWSNNAKLRFCSTSGGIFSELAKKILESGGFAVGAAYTDDLTVHHEIIQDEAGLNRIRQSKYIQSEIGYVFRDVKSKLLNSKSVIFCGAPCQVAALKAYLGKEYEKLFTIDFICRGVNSPKAYLSWINEIETEKRCKATRIWFKYKSNGWKTSPKRTRVDFADGSMKVFDQEKNKFMVGYLGPNLYIRKSCGECKFKGTPRQGDITLADFWGIEKKLDDDQGTSLVLINNEHGRKLFESISDNITCYERELLEIYGGNVCFDGSVKINPNSEKFLLALDRMTFSNALKKYGKPNLLQSVRNIGKRLSRIIDSLFERKTL